jgi:hypothetical protein
MDMKSKLRVTILPVLILSITTTLFSQKINNNSYFSNRTISKNEERNLYAYYNYNDSMKSSRVTVISKEFIYGTLAGTLISVPVGVLVGKISDPDNFGEAIGILACGMYTGFIFGSSLGVYWVAKKDNKNTTFTKTLFSGLIGGAIGASIFFAVDQKGPLSASPLITPTLASILYVNLFNGTPSGESRVTLNFRHFRIDDAYYPVVMVRLQL